MKHSREEEHWEGRRKPEEHLREEERNGYGGVQLRRDVEEYIAAALGGGVGVGCGGGQGYAKEEEGELGKYEIKSLTLSHLTLA